MEDLIECNEKFRRGCSDLWEAIKKVCKDGSENGIL